MTYVQNKWPDQLHDDEFKPYWHCRTKPSSHDGCQLWGHHVVIPPHGITTVLQEIHGGHCSVIHMKSLAGTLCGDSTTRHNNCVTGGHCSIIYMKSLACGLVWWPKLDKEIEAMVRSCSKYQTQQEDPPTVPLIPWHWHTRTIDAHSKRMGVFQMSSTTSNLIPVFSVYVRFGLADRIISDNAPNFVSAEFAKFMKNNGIRH